MKRLFLAALFLILLPSVVHAAGSITIGKGQTYDWSSNTWSTLTSVENVNVTTVASFDGWITAAEVAASAEPISKEWTNTTSWSNDNNGGTASISPAGQMDMLATGVKGGIYRGSSDYYHKWWTVSTLIKLDSPSVYQTVNASDRGYSFQLNDGARNTDWCFATTASGTNFAVAPLATKFINYDTGVTKDLKFHKLTYRLANGVTSGECLIDNVSVKNDMPSSAGGGGGMYLYDYHLTGDPTQTECHLEYTRYFTTSEAYSPTGAAMETDATKSHFNSGTGEGWSTISWTSVNQGLTVQVRCASTSGGLSSAVYETIAASGNSIVTRGQYGQIKLTMAPAYGYKYVPVVKDITFSHTAYTPGSTFIPWIKII